jgi:hypothetical protein
MEQDYEPYIQSEPASEYLKLTRQALCTLEGVQHSVLHSTHDHTSRKTDIQAAIRNGADPCNVLDQVIEYMCKRGQFSCAEAYSKALHALEDLSGQLSAERNTLKCQASLFAGICIRHIRTPLKWSLIMFLA